ncbi:MAG: phosphomethylpyrimidine synthase ThiC [Candidatus Diapherotrites archaeon]
MTQLEKARNNELTKEMSFVSKTEGIDVELLRKKIADGKIVIPASVLHPNLNPIGIGEGLKTKINANIGSSPNSFELKAELEKLDIAIKYGADTVMDLSIGGDIDSVRREIISHSSVPIGTVPIYQAVVDKGNLLDCDEKDFLNGIKKHIEDGVDFITVHSGITKKSIPLVEKRLMGAVSRGGSFLLKWMKHHGKENPFYENFDKILEMAKKYDVTLSLGDGLRPGCLADATDDAQIYELKKLGELTNLCQGENVQVMIEGPGHIPLDQIKKNIEMQKKYCFGAPFYVLGPIVTDVAPGYDHITSAIGGALAAYYGADFLCYVTPSEHLALPDAEDVRQGVIAARIAAHAADIAKGVKGAREWDDRMSKERKNLNWEGMMELAIDPEKAREYRKRCADEETCSMCGEFCSMKEEKYDESKQPGRRI